MKYYAIQFEDGTLCHMFNTPVLFATKEHATEFINDPIDTIAKGGANWQTARVVEVEITVKEK